MPSEEMRSVERSTRVPCASPGGAASARELDYLYNEIDKLYHAYAHGCGVSDCAYWMLYDLEVAGGTLPLAQLTTSWSYSKQTINSAIKSLEAKGLIELTFEEGSRKNKVASFTDEGRAFAARYIVPAQQAERRAFCALPPEDRIALLALAREYTQALAAEFERTEFAAGE